MNALRQLSWLEPVVELMRLACFSLLVALVLWHLHGVLTHVADLQLRRRARTIIWFVLIVSAAVALVQVEAWPFTTWALVHTHRSPEMVSWKLEGSSQDGRIYEIDPRILQPMQAEEFGAWMLPRIEHLSLQQRDELLRFVLVRANEQRTLFLHGEFPPNDRYLGEASAPAHFRMRRIWRTPADVPARPFVGVKVWKLSWNTEQRRLDDAAVVRTLLADFRS
jgi:hypothetical protein